MYVEDEDIVELMLLNRQVKILPKDSDSYEQFKFNCKKIKSRLFNGTEVNISF